jgi:hypothetical protein
MRGRTVAVATLFLWAFGAVAARAIQSPPACNGNGVRMNIQRSPASVTLGSGNTDVNYNVSIANIDDPSIGLSACDVEDVDVIFYCPGPTGAPDLASPQILTTSLALPVPTQAQPIGGTLTCTIAVDPGVFDAVAEVRAGDQEGLLDNLNEGRLHDAPADHAFRAQKQLGTEVVTTTTSTSTSSSTSSSSSTTTSTSSSTSSSTTTSTSSTSTSTSSSSTTSSSSSTSTSSTSTSSTKPKKTTTTSTTKPKKTTTTKKTTSSTTTTKHKTTTTKHKSTTTTTMPVTCKSAKFWGTHGVLTDDVIDAGDGCLEVCGEVITNVGVSSASSALEALCVPWEASARTQLARQLTALALNCVVSGLEPDCGGNTGLAELFASCNAACVGNSSKSALGNCLRKIKCFNGGGVLTSKGYCSDKDAPCRDRYLPSGPDTSKQCHDASSSSCSIVPPGEAKCTQAGLESSSNEDCD